MQEGPCLSPMLPLRSSSDDDVITVRGLSHTVEPKRLGCNPRERLAYYCAFPLKIVVFSYDAEILTPLFIWYDECRRP
jgi:hypothetical protein